MQCSSSVARHAGFVIIGLAVAVGLSLIVHYLMFLGEEINPYQRALAAAVTVPAAVAVPMLVYIGVLRERLRRFRHERNFAAAHDPSTEVLNGNAFATLVERRRSVSVSEAGRTFGAFVIIEAECARTINRDHGYEWGEESMRRVASVIRTSVRRSDIIGRLSDHSFGIFLPGAGEEQARDVGERIREAVANAPFLAEGQAIHLKLDIGGVIFEDQIELKNMMRIVSEQVELARRGGEEIRFDCYSAERKPASLGCSA
ncbi:GGDEF domain-containing protein [Rhizobiales bacterium]|uniref:GGDEF domain-containing protein n=1 Tax=Hongsoonwoonella zoysiae TaxID=2821844 RepID=UPI0015617AA7|nr:GGDEF domain-containing protein [Hongsoonwoonella zoysiae]NRG16417.1 GGDEF domain-containing protein [Hongsoonwoonella zoysiae]